jgi:hypothetical protein
MEDMDLRDKIAAILLALQIECIELKTMDIIGSLLGIINNCIISHTEEVLFHSLMEKVMPDLLKDIQGKYTIAVESSTDIELLEKQKQECINKEDYEIANTIQSRINNLKLINK